MTISIPDLAVAMPCLERQRRILVFDSGLGGLSVLTEISARLDETEIIYVADDAGFPYGAWGEAALVAHIVSLMTQLVKIHSPDLVVIACNTASTLVLQALRATLSVPLVGTVPAIKPAAEASESGLISLLATPATVAREYTRQLIAAHAGHLSVTLVGSALLATLAENYVLGQGIDDATILAEIRPCFSEVNGARTDMVVLGCTHYPLLVDRFKRLAPWQVTWVDGAAAIARRVKMLLSEPAYSPGARALQPRRGRDQIVFTSGKQPAAAFVANLGRFGLRI